MLQSLILIDAMFSACWEKRKRKEKIGLGLFSPGQRLDTPCWLCQMGFS
jgi:hypothetical protein